jgi:hypothetical protein
MKKQINYITGIFLKIAKYKTDFEKGNGIVHLIFQVYAAGMP